MYQDINGFMWFGSYDGLNLYDGKNVISFRYDPNDANSLLGNVIYNILYCDKDHLWVVTQSGLNKFSISERKVTESYSELGKISDLTTDKDGNIWILTENNCISRYNAGKEQFEPIPLEGTKLKSVISFFINSNNSLCIINESGEMLVITSKLSSKSKNDLIASIEKKRIHESRINQIFYDDDSVYFIDEYSDLYLYEGIEGKKILLRNIKDIIDRYGFISSITFFHKELFIAFMHSGLIKIDLSKKENKPEIINVSVGVFDLMKDRFQDALWVGTDGQGVSLYYKEKDRFGNILFDNLPFVSRMPVRAFYTDENNSIWVGTRGYSILRIEDYSKFNNKKIPEKNIRNIKTNKDAHIKPVYMFQRSVFNSNDLWMGTENGISYYSEKDKTLYELEDFSDTNEKLTVVHSLCEVNDSTMWVSSRGLFKITIDKRTKPYRIKKKKFYIFEPNNTNIHDEYRSMTYDGKSKLYAGSRHRYGILCVDIHTEQYNYISIDNTDKNVTGDIIYLYLDNDSVLYVGTSSGLVQIKLAGDEKNRIKRFGKKEGIANDMIHGILKDKEGIIWLSTNKGLVKYNPENDSFFNVKSSEIKVNEYSDNACWRCPYTNRLFFGGVNGFVWIEPKDENQSYNYEPNLLFTELHYFNNKKTLYNYNYNPEEKLELKYEQNTFQINFAVLDYINGANYDFSYKLENYNTDWIPLQNETKIDFINIPAGNYILKVKYKNDTVQDGSKVFDLHITILPPWYLSPLALIIYFLTFIIGIYYTIRYAKKKFERKHELITLRIKEEQAEKLYETKLRFFTNITHELYTPLTIINGSLEQIKKEKESAKLNKYVHIMENNVTSLNDLIKEILDYRKIEESETGIRSLQYISVSKIIDDLIISFSEMAFQNKIHLLSHVEAKLNWYTDRAAFIKIVTNLISNAIKYTPAEGTINVAVSVENNNLKITVYNTGRGIKADKLKTIFNRYEILDDTDINANDQMTARNGLGLYICESMTHFLDGKIEVDSKENEYTEFRVFLPNLMQEQPSDENDIPQKDINNESVFTEIQTEHSILVIDDNKDIVEMLSDTLSDFHTIFKAYNAKDAIEILKKYTPSLIITDILMPETDGLTFIKKVREDKYIKDIPIIALSAKVSEKDQAKGYEIGADAYITKPFSTEILLSVIRRFLKNKEDIKNYYKTTESAYEYHQGLIIHQKDREFIDNLISVIKNNISKVELGPEFIANEMKTSSRSLNHRLKKLLSISTTDFIKDYKLSYAMKLLISTNMSIKEIIVKIGITNNSYFYREFSKKYNISPKQYRDLHRKDSDQY